MSKPTQAEDEELKTGYIKVQLDYAPRDSDKKFRQWCKEHDFDCFGLGNGREAWCSSLSTYLRGASGVAYADGEPFLFYEEDLFDVDAYHQQQLEQAVREAKITVLEDLRNGCYREGDGTEFVYMREIDQRIAELQSTKEDKSNG